MFACAKRKTSISSEWYLKHIYNLHFSLCPLSLSIPISLSLSMIMLCFPGISSFSVSLSISSLSHCRLF